LEYAKIVAIDLIDGSNFLFVLQEEEEEAKEYNFSI